MAGHSHAKNVMHRKAKQNEKKAKVYAKIGKAITIAVKTNNSNDPELNSRLKFALKQAQIAGVPKEIIKRALEKSNEKDDLEEVLYEGYAQGGIAVLVEAVTSNKNKTAPEIRAIFSKYKGSMSEPNSVAFMFNHLGVIECKTDNDNEKFFEIALSLNAKEIEDNVAFFEISDFHAAQEELEKHFEILDAQLCYIPENLVECENKENFYKMLEALEENESVQNCWHTLKE